MLDGCVESLRDAFGDDLDICDIKTPSESTKGEGFISEIFYFKVKTDRKLLDLVVKAIPKLIKEDMRKNVISLFSTERTFYDVVWPILDSHQKENQILVRSGELYNRIPKYYGSFIKNDSRFIILENVKALNFSLREKHNMYDKQLVELLFENLGHFHALSISLKDRKSVEYNTVANSLKRTWTEFIKWNIIEDSIRVFSKMIPHLPNEDMNKRVSLLQERISEELEEVTLYKGNHDVILHGDCWINNFLFKTNDTSEDICDIRCLDFQLNQIGTPVYDLSYCFYTGATKELLADLDYFLRVYHNKLSSVLTDFGSSVDKLYPFEVLKQEWKQYSKFGFIMSLMVWRSKTSDQIVDIRDADSAEQPVQHDNCDEEKYAQVIGDLFEHMYKNGFI